MGANEKHDTTYHGREYDFGSPEVVTAKRVRFMSDSAFDHWLETVRAEAKAEALESLAEELAELDRAGADEPVSAYDTAIWIRARADQYKGTS